MNYIVEYIFWISVILIFYVYLGYPLLIYILSKLWPAKSINRKKITPSVTLIITAYNEGKVIGKKIENSLGLDYPQGKLEIIVSSDGSTDKTNEIVRKYKSQGVKLVALKENQGKSSAENYAVKIAAGNIILFSDATGMFNPDIINKVVRNFADKTVGCVTGWPKYTNEDETNVSKGEGIYVKYEMSIRKFENGFGNLVSASGTAFAIRKNLFKPLDKAVGEDFVLPMKAAIEGYRTIHDPEVVSVESVTTSSEGMFGTRIRVTSKDLRGVFLCREILNPIRFPKYFFGLVSHKLLRWSISIIAVVAFVTNIFLLSKNFYFLTLIFQIGFYSLGLMGYIWQQKKTPPRLINFIFIFCLYNLAAFMGLWRFIQGDVSGHWKPVR